MLKQMCFYKRLANTKSRNRATLADLCILHLASALFFQAQAPSAYSDNMSHSVYSFKYKSQSTTIQCYSLAFKTMLQSRAEDICDEKNPWFRRSSRWLKGSRQHAQPDCVLFWGRSQSCWKCTSCCFFSRLSTTSCASAPLWDIHNVSAAWYQMLYRLLLIFTSATSFCYPCTTLLQVSSILVPKCREVVQSL